MPFKSEFCKYEGAKTGDQTKLRAADLQDAVRENPDYLGPGWPQRQFMKALKSRRFGQDQANALTVVIFR